MSGVYTDSCVVAVFWVSNVTSFMLDVFLTVTQTAGGEKGWSLEKVKHVLLLISDRTD